MRKALAILCLLSTISLAHASAEVRCPRVVTCPGTYHTCTSGESQGFYNMGGTTLDNNSDYAFSGSYVLDGGHLICNYVETKGAHAGKEMGEIFEHEGMTSIEEILKVNPNYIVNTASTYKPEIMCRSNDPQVCAAQTA